MHADQKLYLVFEFLDVDLKRYIETGNQNRTPITLQIVKVNFFFFRVPLYLRVMHSMAPVKTRHGNASRREIPCHWCGDSTGYIIMSALSILAPFLLATVDVFYDITKSSPMT